MYVAGEHTAIMGTGHQPPEGDLSLGVFGAVVTGENLLNPLEGLGIDEEWVRTVIGFSRPLEESDIEPVCQDFMDVIPAHRLAEICLQHLAKRGQCVRSGRIELHDPYDHG
ncbi:MAG: hypothetical protein HIU87_15095 [Acidobacteria bacterium]|nr:hypothetical protein [Acidobacteriota bacterium]